MVKMLASLALVAVSLVSAVNGLPATGFVTTSGTEFRLNGRKFFFAGTNSYWAQFTTVSCLQPG